MKNLSLKQMTSREVAEITGKEHKQIMRDIRDEINKLEKGGEDTGYKFVLSSYNTHSNTKSYEMYNLSIEGVLQLAARYDAVVRSKLIDMAMGKQQKIENISPQLQYLIGLEQRVNGIENKLNEYIPDENYSTVSAYCALNKIKLTKGEAIQAGKKIKKKCDKENVEVKLISDSRYGMINSYPISMIKRYFIWLEKQNF